MLFVGSIPTFATKFMNVIVTVKFTNGCQEDFFLKPEASTSGSYMKMYDGKDFIEFQSVEDKSIRIPFNNVMYYAVRKIAD